MATDVSMEIISEANSCLITRDFLGVCFGIESKELDLDLHVPNGWEKRLDLKSGKVYTQRTKPANSSFEQRNLANESMQKRHDLNIFSQAISSNALIKPTIGLLEQPSLDLKLITKNSPTTYTSVCTLDKVKSALERASPTSSSSSSLSSKRHWSMMSSTIVRSQSKSPPSASSFCLSEERESSSWPSSENRGLLVAAACPGCLLYVLILKNDRKCPKCSSVVDLPVNVMTKKPKIDLNISI